MTAKMSYGKELSKEILSRLNVLVTILTNSADDLVKHIQTLQDRKMTFALISGKNDKVFLARESINSDPLEIVDKKPLTEGTVLNFYLKGELM